MRTVREIIVHCSGSDLAIHDSIEVMRHWHVEENGWSDVGYHYFIRQDGLIELGRHVEKVGAHCKGKNNSSIGICLHGDKHFTDVQFKVLRLLVDQLRFQYKLAPEAVFGHRDFAKHKTCPNFDVRAQLEAENWN